MSNQVNTPDTAPMTEQQVNELVQVRLDKLAALCEAGQNPYEITKYNVTALNSPAGGRQGSLYHHQIRLYQLQRRHPQGV